MCSNHLTGIFFPRPTYMYLPCRFHDPDNEPTVGHDVVPVLDDNIQVSTDQYRSQLYQVRYAF